MNLFDPAFGLLAVLAALIVAQYVLKMRRPRTPVSSTLLWQRAVEDRSATAPWQRLHPDPLLLLQLAALLALVLALMRPYVLHAGAPERDVVVVFDASLSTQTTDQGQRRFDRILDQVRSQIDALPADRTMSIIRMDSHPRILMASSSNHDALRRALSGQTPGFDAPDSRAALALALGLAGTGPTEGASTLIEVFRSADTVLSVLHSAGAYRDVAVGRSAAPNLGIAAFAVAVAADGSVTGLTRITNTGGVTLRSDLQVRADGVLEDLQSVVVPPGQSVAVQSLGLPATSGAYEARLSIDDALASDNTAWSFLPAPVQRRVLLVSPGNAVFRAALAALPGIVLQQETPASYRRDVAVAASAVIFDRWLPPVLPRTNLLLVAPPSGTVAARLALLVAAGTRTAETPQLIDDPAALFRYTTPGAMHIYRTAMLGAPSWAHVALADRRGPLVLESSRGPSAAPVQIVVLGFDPEQSDLWAGIDFPVLVSNILNWLAPQTVLSAVTVHPGEGIQITMPPGTSAAQVQTPDGVLVALPAAEGSQSAVIATFKQTTIPGPYTVNEAPGRVRHVTGFAVNTGLVSRQAPAALTRSAESTASPLNRLAVSQIPQEMTGLVIVVVVALLALEWYVAMSRR